MKLCSLNLHDMDCYSDKIADLCKIIRKESPNIVCFQEINKKTAKTLNKLLKMEYIFYGGLAIFSDTKITFIKGIHLKRDRWALLVEIEKLKILVTHIDHEFEKRRMEELLVIDDLLGTVDFLIGDLNSLHLDDYGTSKLKSINDSRKLSNWELSKGDVMTYLKKKGFRIAPYTDYTCRFFTRIDYILHFNKVKTNQKVINCIDNDITDHNMVVAEFKY